MTDAGIEILERIKENKEFTLSGDSGGYSQILYKEDKFYFVRGFGAVEEARSEINPETVLDDVKRFFINKNRYSKSGHEISTDEEVLEYWNNNGHYG